VYCAVVYNFNLSLVDKLSSGLLALLHLQRHHFAEGNDNFSEKGKKIFLT
jgi:hypothetical protein